MVLKYIFDLLVALIGLLVLWPVLLIVAVLVKVKMPGGPVFFVQKRVGKNGRLFDCHKFRTMTVKHNGSTVSVAGNCYYYRHYSFIKDFQMILCTVLGKNMKYAGEVI